MSFRFRFGCNRCCYYSAFQRIFCCLFLDYFFSRFLFILHIFHVIFNHFHINGKKIIITPHIENARLELLFLFLAFFFSLFCWLCNTRSTLLTVRISQFFSFFFIFFCHFYFCCARALRRPKLTRSRIRIRSRS